jgi:flavorubredoxin
MHHSTKRMVDHLVGALIDRGVAVDQFNLVVTDLGKLAMALVDAATILIGTPVVLNGPHPAAAYAAFVTNMLKPKARFVGFFGSFGWKGKKADSLTGMMSNLKAEFLEPVWCKGHPTEADLRDLDGLADAIATRHGELALS